MARASAQGLALAGLSNFRVDGDRDADSGGLVIGYVRPPAHAFRARWPHC